MPSIPLPFVMALLLAILFVRVLALSAWRLRPPSVFIAACLVLVTTVGLRWTADLQWTRFIQPVVASLLPPIAWFCFSDLSNPYRRRAWPHLLVPVSVFLLSSMWQRWQPPIDLILAFLYFGYGAALVRGVYAARGEFESARLTDMAHARRAVLLVAALLLMSGTVDLLIAADFDLYQGNHAASIVAATHMLMLPLIAWTIVVMSRSIPDEVTANDRSAGAATIAADVTPIAAAPNDDDHSVLAAIDRTMRENKLYRDPDLTLGRLARRLAMPARQISGAISRASSGNVSQVVNGYRIREAERLLKETDLTVTAVMFECGFQTKSNFNREFLRITGMNPRAYRLSQTPGANTPHDPTAGQARLQPESL
ncbi:AraC family transcriptional regulator [Ensifer sp.]|jgi:AraC-like DNA-binding protein|uniref:helix-turn-helix domain-containing protein n=1 Tax=Ensifer sp. TaxID=1872086 RepID=UPI002E160DD3|nr:AraC family transcriptional regulator [Ensifer sp.]